MVSKEKSQRYNKRPEVVKEIIIIEEKGNNYTPSSNSSSQLSKENDQNYLPQTGTHSSVFEMVLGFGLLIISLCGFQWLRKRYN